MSLPPIVRDMDRRISWLRPLFVPFITVSILTALPAMAICEPGTVKPHVTIEYLGPDDYGDGIARVGFSFPNTDDPAQRGLSLYIDRFRFVSHPGPVAGTR
jgi:hypothetical protein